MNVSLRTLIALVAAFGLLTTVAFAQESVTLDTPVIVTAGATPVELSLTTEASIVIAISARAITEGVDPVLTLLNESGVEIARNDDNFGGRDDLSFYDSLIEGQALDAGTYTIRLGVFSGEGEVEILVTTDMLPGSEPFVRGEAPFRALRTFDFSGTIRPGLVETHTFEVNAGDIIIATALSDDGLDTRIALFDGDVLLYENDDHSSLSDDLQNLESRIFDYYIDTTGPYTLEVGGYGRSSGAYQASIAVIATGVQLGAEALLDSLTVDVPPDDFFFYDLPVLPVDAYYSVTLVGLDDIDPLIIIVDEDFTIINANDDHGSPELNDDLTDNFDSRLRVYVPAGATYTIAAGNYKQEAGSAILTIRAR